MTWLNIIVGGEVKRVNRIRQQSIMIKSHNCVYFFALFISLSSLAAASACAIFLFSVSRSLWLSWMSITPSSWCTHRFAASRWEIAAMLAASTLREVGIRRNTRFGSVLSQCSVVILFVFHHKSMILNGKFVGKLGGLPTPLICWCCEDREVFHHIFILFFN